MKKKILLVMLCTLCLLKTTGCGKEKVKPKEVSTKTDKEIYLEVVDGKKDYVNTDNQSQNISKYLEQFKENGKSTISYTMVDLDNDKKEEMIVLIENNDGYYLILNIENNNVYGFEKNYRDMTVIKKDGRLRAEGGSEYFGIYTITFDKNNIKENTLAERNGNETKVDGNIVQEKEFNNYLEEFDKKENVTFEKYKEINNNVEPTKNGFQAGTHILDYTTYYLVLADGSLSKNEGNEITIKEDGSCEFLEGMANSDCQSYYSSKTNNDDYICFKLGETKENRCFKIIDDYFSNGTSVYKKQ